MPQYTYDYDSTGLVGAIATAEPHDIITVENPLNAQVTNLEYNGVTTDGDYSITAVGEDGSTATSDVFTASSNTAAQIVAGLVTKCLSNPAFAGLISAVALATTDNLVISFLARGVEYTVTANCPSTGPTQSNTTTAGYTEVDPAIILQADGSGGFTTTYTDAALALGVVMRSADLLQPLLPNGVDGYTGPSQIPLMAMGTMWVPIASGVTVSRGNKVYFNPTAKTWSNASSGSHVLVEGAQWRTSGTTKQRVWLRLPSET